MEYQQCHVAVPLLLVDTYCNLSLTAYHLPTQHIYMRIAHTGSPRAMRWLSWTGKMSEPELQRSDCRRHLVFHDVSDALLGQTFFRIRNLGSTIPFRAWPAASAHPVEQDFGRSQASVGSFVAWSRSGFVGMPINCSSTANSILLHKVLGTSSMRFGRLCHARFGLNIF